MSYTPWWRQSPKSVLYVPDDPSYGPRVNERFDAQMSNGMGILTSFVQNVVSTDRGWKIRTQNSIYEVIRHDHVVCQLCGLFSRHWHEIACPRGVAGQHQVGLVG